MKRNAKQKQRQITQKQKTKNKMQFQSTRAARVFLWVGIGGAALIGLLIIDSQPATPPPILPLRPACPALSCWPPTFCGLMLLLPLRLLLLPRRIASHNEFFSLTHNLLLLLLMLLLALQFVAGRCVLLRKSVSKMLCQQQHEFKKLSV